MSLYFVAGGVQIGPPEGGNPSHRDPPEPGRPQQTPGSSLYRPLTYTTQFLFFFNGPANNGSAREVSPIAPVLITDLPGRRPSPASQPRPSRSLVTCGKGPAPRQPAIVFNLSKVTVQCHKMQSVCCLAGHSRCRTKIFISYALVHQVARQSMQHHNRHTFRITWQVDTRSSGLISKTTVTGPDKSQIPLVLMGFFRIARSFLLVSRLVD